MKFARPIGLGVRLLNRYRIELALIEARPRVLGSLQSRLNNLDLVEESFQEACIRALAHWPGSGLPKSPAAWLFKVSLNCAIDSIRKNKSHLEFEFSEQIETSSLVESLSYDLEQEITNLIYKDEILRLLFCCCHPELKAKDQMALALKVIGGFTTSAIAKAFLCKEKAMEQRITRAKKKAYRTADRLTNPTASERQQRLKSVMTLLYLIFNEGYSNTGGENHLDINLCKESIRLIHLLIELFPGDPELLGLLALFSFQHARYPARTDGKGNLLSLERQNRCLWRGDLIKYGEAILKKALRKNLVGVYQIQAAIAAEHCKAASSQETRWDKILSFYDTLFLLKPSPVVLLNRAVAISKVKSISEALAELVQIQERMSGYLYFHTTKAGLLQLNQQHGEALTEYYRAKTLNPTSPELKYIESQIADIQKIQ